MVTSVTTKTVCRSTLRCVYPLYTDSYEEDLIAPHNEKNFRTESVRQRVVMEKRRIRREQKTRGGSPINDSITRHRLRHAAKQSHVDIAHPRGGITTLTNNQKKARLQIKVDFACICTFTSSDKGTCTARAYDYHAPRVRGLSHILRMARL